MEKRRNKTCKKEILALGIYKLHINYMEIMPHIYREESTIQGTALYE
jgi:hypothetical protein